jgi:CheY-like chemotaxis protein
MSALHKVLIVDDDPVVTKSFDRVLSEQGYVVVTACNGDEALTKLKEGEYDVVFTDIKMPGMDGIELAERVKARRSWTPVVIVTGYGSKANEERARAAGVSAFLQKPLSPEQIETSAREAMAQPVQTQVLQVPAQVLQAPAWGIPIEAQVEASEPGSLKKATMAAAAPFKGLAYIVALPFVGLAMLASMGARAYAEKVGLKGTLQFFRNAAMLAAAPFIGLAYALAMPFVGLGALAVMGARALAKKAETSTTARVIQIAGMAVAAPFIGLAYVIAMPFVGLGAMLWIGLRSIFKKTPQVG